MSAISAPAVRERARDIFFQTLRARYWTEEQRNAIEINVPSSRFGGGRNRRRQYR